MIRRVLCGLGLDVEVLEYGSVKYSIIHTVQYSTPQSEVV